MQSDVIRLEPRFEAPECLMGCHTGHPDQPISASARAMTEMWLEYMPGEGVPLHPGFRPNDYPDRDELIKAAIAYRSQRAMDLLVTPVLQSIERAYSGQEIPPHVQELITLVATTNCDIAFDVLETHLELIKGETVTNDQYGQSVLLFGLKEKLPSGAGFQDLPDLRSYLAGHTREMRLAIPITATCPHAGAILTAMEWIFDQSDGSNNGKWNLTGLDQRAQEFIAQRRSGRP